MKPQTSASFKLAAHFASHVKVHGSVFNRVTVVIGEEQTLLRKAEEKARQEVSSAGQRQAGAGSVTAKRDSLPAKLEKLDLTV